MNFDKIILKIDPARRSLSNPLLLFYVQLAMNI